MNNDILKEGSPENQQISTTEHNLILMQPKEIKLKYMLKPNNAIDDCVHSKIASPKQPNSNKVSTIVQLEHSKSKCRMKPNITLTIGEREAKRKLKQKLKIQTKIQKLEKRIICAQSRKDPIVEKQAQQQLTQLFLDAKKDRIMNHDCNGNSVIKEFSKNVATEYLDQVKISAKRVSKEAIDNNEEKEAKRWIISIANNLFQLSNENIKHKKDNDKEYQTKQAVKLLKHMTKGTQHQSMFDDPSALWGYTRQKFNERALLFYSSMDKLRRGSHCPIKFPFSLVNAVGEEGCLTSEQEIIRQKAWDIIQNGNIRNVCSVGCGPGNDTLGMLCFLRMVNKIKQKKNIIPTNVGFIDLTVSMPPIILLDRLILLDWAIEEWKGTVLQPFINILQERNLARNINHGFCDITKKLHDDCNTLAWEMMFCTEIDEIEKADTKINKKLDRQSNSQKESMSKRKCTSTCDLFIVSYVLSETREKWESFFTDLVCEVGTGTMFYFAEPAPWQLHHFHDLFRHSLDFLWIDSSMYYPSLQRLDRRAGPAILFAIKK